MASTSSGSRYIPPAGWLGKRAIGATVAAQRGQRDEDFAAVGHDVAPALVTQSPGVCEQGGVVDAPFQIAKGEIGVRWGGSVLCSFPAQAMPDDDASLMPPSTGRMTPVIQSAASEARNTIARAMSSGVPRRPRGCIPAATASSCQSISESLVLTTAGATALTRIEGASSSASCRVRVDQACL